MKKKLLLLRLVVLMTAMMCALGAAAAEAYACYTESNTTLTFYYDNLRSSRPGETFDLNTGSNSPAWDYVDLNENVRKVVFHSSFASARPTSTCRWFADKLLLESIEGLNYLNTSAVTIMANMFSYSYLIGNLDLSHFNTANVTDMSYMFGEFHTEKRLLNLSSFDTRNVTKMDYMFGGSNVKTIIVGDGWTTENVASGYGMFAFCRGLVGGMGSAYHMNQDGIEYAHIDGGESNPGYFTSAQDYNSKPYAVLTIEGQDFGSRQILTFYNDHQRLSHSEITYGIEIIESSNFFMNVGPEWYIPDDNEYSNINGVVFDPSFASARPKNTYNWFAKMRFLDDITGIEYLNTSEVTNMANMFKGCINLTAIDLSHFNTSKVTDMEYMFQDCQQLLQLDLSHFNTSNVTNMEGMFDGCQRLSQLDVTNFNTSNVTNMEYMFHDCQRLLQLDLSHFDTGSVTTMRGMFGNCESLNSIDMRSFNTQNVTDMNAMFFYCQSLITLELSSFNTSNVRNMSQMFQGCTSLQTIIVSDQWTTASLSVTGNSTFNDCTSLVGGMGTVYDSNHCGEDYAHIDGGPSNPGYLSAVPEAYACYNPGNTTLTFYYDTYRNSRTGTTYDLNTGFTSPGWRSDGMYSSVTKVNFHSDFSNARPTSTYRWFCDMQNLETITGISYLNTSEVTEMRYMFYNCSKLTSIDLSHFNTAKVTNMGYMFSGCSALTNLDVHYLKTDQVTDMRGMFSNTTALTSLYLIDFNTAKVTNMSYMFYGCSNMTAIYVDGTWNTAAVTSSGNMFYNCTKLVGAQGTAYDANHIDKAYAHIDGGTSNPGYFTEYEGPEAYACYMPNGTMTFYYDTWRDRRTNMGGWTYALNSGSNSPDWYNDGQSANVKTVVFSRSFADYYPSSTYHWFAEMYDLTSIEGMQFLNTSEVTNMAGMFWECGALPAVDVSGFDTRKVTDMSAMFAECYELTALDVSSWNTSYVTDMSWMFSDCSELTSLDVSHFNTSNVTNMSQLFGGCSGLTSLDVSNFDTSNVTDMSWMFSWCNGLQQLDLSGFNTSKVTNMSCMFNECETLKTIYVGDGWSTATVTSSSSMFDVCHSLVGGKGTAYSSSNPKDKTYAHIDGGTSNPGYFSEKGGAFLRGDVNGDGSVTISDVTALIDLLLGGGTINNPAADCNGDSNVTISDVTALIDYLLGGNW